MKKIKKKETLLEVNKSVGKNKHKQYKIKHNFLMNNRTGGTTVSNETKILGKVYNKTDQLH